MDGGNAVGLPGRRQDVFGWKYLEPIFQQSLPMYSWNHWLNQRFACSLTINTGKVFQICKNIINSRLCIMNFIWNSTAVPLILHRHTGLDLVSSMLLKPLDSGLRRNDGRMLLIFMSPIHQILYFPCTSSTIWKLDEGNGKVVLKYHYNIPCSKLCSGFTL